MMKAGMKNIPMPTTAERKNKNHKVPRRSEGDGMLLMISRGRQCSGMGSILSDFAKKKTRSAKRTGSMENVRVYCGVKFW
jgi:hypothetical protein